MHPGTFWKFSKDCAAKLAVDDCYSDETKKAFIGFSFTLDEALISYKHIENVIAEFTGNAEKFYPRFYDAVCTPSFFPRLSSKCARIFGCEVANHVLVHLNSLSSKPDGKLSESIKKVNSVEVSEKEHNTIAYMRGYVFHTVHKRLCKSKSMKSSELKEKYLALLEAGKKSSDVPRPYEALIEQKNRGGLWTMERFVVLMFQEVEKHFRIKVIEQSTFKIDSKEIIHSLMQDCYILSLWSSLSNKCNL